MAPPSVALPKFHREQLWWEGDAKDKCGFAAMFNIEVRAGLARLLDPPGPHAQGRLRPIAGFELTR